MKLVVRGGPLLVALPVASTKSPTIALLFCAVPLLCLAGPVQGQSSSALLRPEIPPDYDRGRNVSVMERPRPDFAPLGIRSGSLLAFPALEIGATTASNVYLSPGPDIRDSFFTIQPSIGLHSDLARHAWTATGRAAFRRYANETALDRNEWEFRSTGRIDIDGYHRAFVQAEAATLSEDPFTSALTPSAAALSVYSRIGGELRFDRQIGRSRLSLSANAARLRFSEIDDQSQKDRNRRTLGAVARAEWALSPGVSLFGQASVTDTDYQMPVRLDLQPNLDSISWRLLGGINMDISGVARGTVGVGYSRRNYSSSEYDDVSGLSIEAELTYFLSASTNIRLNAERRIEDAALADNLAYMNSGVTLGVDQDIGERLIVTGSAGYWKQDFFASTDSNESYRFTARAKFLATRNLWLRLEGAHASRQSFGSAPLPSINETSANITLGVQL